MGDRWSKVLGLVGLAALIAGAGPLHAGAAQTTGPPYVAQQAAVRAYSHDPSGVAVDRWAVWVCEVDPSVDVGSAERLSVTPSEAATALTDDLASYFLWLSDGAYQPTFTPQGTLAPGPGLTLGEVEDLCRAQAVAGSAGFQGAMVVLTSPGLGAEASSGHEMCGGVVPCTASVLPDSDRAAVMGGGTVFDTTTYGPADLATAAHELGHALDWAHADAGLFTAANTDQWALLNAQLTPGFQLPPADLDDLRELVLDPSTPPDVVRQTLRFMNGALEYGDVTDIMGATPMQRADAAPRDIVQTMAFNRFAAGWIADEDIVVHAGGLQVVDLTPIGVDGVQMVVLPTGDERTYRTLEVRAATPFFPGEAHAGVIVHRIDQRPQVCGHATEPCWGEAWRTEAIGGLPFGFGQVMGVAEARTIDGVRVEVLAIAADGTATVQLGTPEPAAPSTTTTTAAPAPAPVVARPSFTG